MAKQPASVNGLIKTNIFLSATDKAAIKARAIRENVSYSTLIRQAIAHFLGSTFEPYSFRQSK